MGKVYRAVQLPLNRAVAIKLLDSRYGAGKDESFKQRFLVEAALTSKLNHPNTVRVLDYGSTRDGLFFLAMEYLDGETLEKLLTRGAAALAPGVEHRPADGARAARGARAGRGAPRPEARQRGAAARRRRRRLRQGARLRAGEVLRRRPRARGPGHHPAGHADGQPAVHGARAGGEEPRRPAQRHLLAGHDALRDAQREAALQRRWRARGDPQARERAGAAAGDALEVRGGARGAGGASCCSAWRSRRWIASSRWTSC